MSSWVQPYFLGMRLLSLNSELVTSMLRSNCWATVYSSLDSVPAPPEPDVVSPTTTEPAEAGAPACVSTSSSLREHATAVATRSAIANTALMDPR